MTQPMLYYEVHGNKGPYLLLVHGLMSSRVQWMKNIDALCTFCRPVIVELLGHGRSPSPDAPQCYHPETYISEFEKIRSILGAGSWLLCGQSLGASLTLRYSLMHPDRIVAQVFTNSRSAFSETSSKERTRGLVALLKQDGKKVLEALPVHPAKSRYLEPAVKRALIKDIELIDINGFSNTLLFMSPKSSVRDIVHTNKVPTLMVVGKYDRQFLPLSTFAKQHMPHLKAVNFEGGHAVNIDVADAFNEAVAEFVKRHSDT